MKYYQKIILSLAIIFILTACNSEPYEIHEPPVMEIPPNDSDNMAMGERCDCGYSLIRETIHSAPPLNILPFKCRAFDDYDVNFMYEFIDSFEYIHNITYHQWDGGWNPLTVIWTDTLVSDLSLVKLSTNEALLTIDEFLPGEALVANLLFAHYLIPSVGIEFTDENNMQKRMFIAEDMNRSAPCPCFGRFVLVPYDERESSEWYWHTE